MMDAGFWLGVATPFDVLILFGVTRLLLRAISALMRLLNRKVHDRFMRRYVFHEEIDAGGNVNHARNARELAEVCAALARSRASRVLLVPLMLVAGDHAQNDMAGPGPHSWRSVLAGQGYRVDWVRHGPGSEKAVQDLYAAHLRGVRGGGGAPGP